MDETQFVYSEMIVIINISPNLDSEKVAELLIKNGANVNAENKFKLKPIHIAAKHGILFYMYNTNNQVYHILIYAIKIIY